MPKTRAVLELMASAVTTLEAGGGDQITTRVMIKTKKAHYVTICSKREGYLNGYRNP